MKRIVLAPIYYIYMYIYALTFINKPATSELLNIPITAIPPCFIKFHLLLKNPKMEDSSEIGKDSFSNHKLEEVLKIQLITVTDKNY